jgi:hypothetical protein
MRIQGVNVGSSAELMRLIHADTEVVGIDEAQFSTAICRPPAPNSPVAARASSWPASTPTTSDVRSSRCPC